MFRHSIHFTQLKSIRVDSLCVIIPAVGSVVHWIDSIHFFTKMYLRVNSILSTHDLISIKTRSRIELEWINLGWVAEKDVNDDE